jgi:2,4-dienoyl-CoA reductase-like NADH-dependent reductase (Old Yellow Enzyme family)
MTQLFEALRVGALTLPNRIVMAPLGRARADAQNREPTLSVVTYYVQRATAGDRGYVDYPFLASPPTLEATAAP